MAAAAHRGAAGCGSGAVFSLDLTDMRVLIYTSSGSTAHDSAAEAIQQWLAQLVPEVEVRVDQVLEHSSGASSP